MLAIKKLKTNDEDAQSIAQEYFKITIQDDGSYLYLTKLFYAMVNAPDSISTIINEDKIDLQKRVLFKKTPDQTEYWVTPIIFSLLQQFPIAIIHTLIQHGAKLNFSSTFKKADGKSFRHTPLTIAIMYNLAAVNDLLTLGADPNQEFVQIIQGNGHETWTTPLLYAISLASSTNIAVVKALLEHRADINRVTKTKVYKYKQGTNSPTLQDITNHTPLSFTITHKPEIMEFIIENGADPTLIFLHVVDAEDKKIYQASLSCELSVHHSRVLDIERKYLSLGSRDAKIKEIIDVTRSHESRVSYLLTYGTDPCENPNSQGHYGLTPLRSGGFSFLMLCLQIKPYLYPQYLREYQTEDSDDSDDSIDYIEFGRCYSNKAQPIIKIFKNIEYVLNVWLFQKASNPLIAQLPQEIIILILAKYLSGLDKNRDVAFFVKLVSNFIPEFLKSRYKLQSRIISLQILNEYISETMPLNMDNGSMDLLSAEYCISPREIAEKHSGIFRDRIFSFIRFATSNVKIEKISDKAKGQSTTKIEALDPPEEIQFSNRKSTIISIKATNLSLSKMYYSVFNQQLTAKSAKEIISKKSMSLAEICVTVLIDEQSITSRIFKTPNLNSHKAALIQGISAAVNDWMHGNNVEMNAEIENKIIQFFIDKHEQAFTLNDFKSFLNEILCKPIYNIM